MTVLFEVGQKPVYHCVILKALSVLRVLTVTGRHGRLLQPCTLCRLRELPAHLCRKLAPRQLLPVRDGCWETRPFLFASNGVYLSHW
ncbi:hypothetical protein BaRGS_00015040, partial [Batillaria attramentaria]